MEGVQKNINMIIDVSGYSYSGKGAVLDILRDFPSLNVHKKEFEFLLIRATDGLVDLREALIENPSEIRADMALKRFIKLINTFAAKPTSLSQPSSIFTPPGQNYSKIFPNFTENSSKFITKISTTSEEYWPFPSLYKSNIDSLLEKVNKFFFSHNTIKHISYSTQKDFDRSMNLYLRNVLFSGITKEKQKIVTGNMLEVYNPPKFFRAIQPCKLVIVDRDPRAIYISIPGNLDRLNDIVHAQKFIEKFKYQRSNFFLQNLIHDNILIVRFEDIFIDFHAFISKLSVFIDEPIPSSFSNFSFEKSIKNIEPWKNFKDLRAIKLIEDELLDFSQNWIEQA